MDSLDSALPAPAKAGQGLIRATCVLFWLACLGCCAAAEPAREKREEPKEIPEKESVRPKMKMDMDWLVRHFEAQVRLNQEKPGILFIGDSITQFWENEGAPVWREKYAERKALNLGVAGDQTGHVLWRLKHLDWKGASPSAIVLLIGINNIFDGQPAEDIRDGIAVVIRRLKELFPESGIILLGLFPAGLQHESESRTTIRRLNLMLDNLAEREKEVRFLDLGSKFLETGGRLRTDLMPDHVHLSERGYRVWAEAMDDTLSFLLMYNNGSTKARNQERPPRPDRPK